MLQGGCGSPALSAIFFCSFTVLITMILLNLFTAVVLENFEIQEEQAEWTLTPAALEVRATMMLLHTHLPHSMIHSAFSHTS